MRHRIVRILLLSSLPFCVACEVASLEPWFGDDVRVFDERLLGTWRGDDLVFEVERGPENGYIVHVSDGEERFEYKAVLAKIEGRHYVDHVFVKPSPSPDDDPPPEWFYYVHSLVSLELAADKIRVRDLNEDRVQALIDAGALHGAENGRDQLIILSSTERLESFLASHAKDTDLWDDGEWFERLPGD